MNIKHEAEVQRQHTRYKIPLQAEIAGEVFNVLDWSLGGLGLSGSIEALRQGKKVDIKLTFPFDVLAMSLNVEAEPVYVDQSKGRAGLKFVNLTRQQSNILRFVIDAYLSGEIVGVGDLIEVSARHSEAKSRPTPTLNKLGALQRAGRFGGRLTRGAILTICSVAVLGFLGVSLKDRLFTIRANMAVVTTDLVVIPAPVGGSLSFVSDQEALKRGDPIATVDTIDGRSVFVNSPCDCAVHRRYATAGDYTTFGTPVVALRRNDSRTYVAAYVPPDRALELMGGWHAKVQLANGVRVENATIEFTPVDGRPDSALLTKVIVNIDEELAASHMGQPARVVFETPLLAQVRNRIPRSVLSWLGIPAANATEAAPSREKRLNAGT